MQTFYVGSNADGLRCKVTPLWHTRTEANEVKCEVVWIKDGSCDFVWFDIKDSETLTCQLGNNFAVHKVTVNVM